jgi:uncharacterized protein (TIGR03435 family)
MKSIHGVNLILASAAVFAQAPVAQPSRPEFEVASVKPSAPAQMGQGSVGIHIDGAQLRCSTLSMKDYIGFAYRLRGYQISGPDWLPNEKFDISATLPAGVPRDKVPEMMQALLEDRFQMKVHREKRDFPVYVLSAAKSGPKMKEVAPDAVDTASVNVTGGGSAAGVMLNLGNGSTFAFADNKLEARKLSMESFSDTLGRFVDRPVVNQTELKGSYDFTLEFAPEDFRAMHIRSAVNAGVVLPPEALRALEYGSSDSLFAAVQTVGLKLERKKAPLDVLVIDKIERSPTAN